MSKVFKVALSVPNESYIPVESYDNHLYLASHIGRLQEIWKNEGRDPRYEFGWFTTGRLLTPYAREKLAEFLCFIIQFFHYTNIAEKRLL